MSSPQGILLDSQGRLWVVDRLNNRVLRFNAVSNKANGASANRVLGQPNLTSAASNQGGAASASTLSDPLGIALDASDNLCVADSGNDRMLRYAGASAIAADGVPASQVLGQADRSPRSGPR